MAHTRAQTAAQRALLSPTSNYQGRLAAQRQFSNARNQARRTQLPASDSSSSGSLQSWTTSSATHFAYTLSIPPVDIESLTDLGDPRRVQPARDEDWEPAREAITQLYWTENRELHEVMKIMEARHNFGATERQYKTRFKKWKLEKNIDSKTMEAIVQKQKRRREDENKETEFSHRGRPVLQEKIDRWQKRQKSGEIPSPHCLEAPTPSGIEYGTPASVIVLPPSVPEMDLSTPVPDWRSSAESQPYSRHFIQWRSKVKERPEIGGRIDRIPFQVEFIV